MQGFVGAAPHTASRHHALGTACCASAIQQRRESTLASVSVQYEPQQERFSSDAAGPSSSRQQQQQQQQQTPKPLAPSHLQQRAAAKTHAADQQAPAQRGQVTTNRRATGRRQFYGNPPREAQAQWQVSSHGDEASQRQQQQQRPRPSGPPRAPGPSNRPTTTDNYRSNKPPGPTNRPPTADSYRNRDRPSPPYQAKQQAARRQHSALSALSQARSVEQLVQALVSARAQMSLPPSQPSRPELSAFVGGLEDGVDAATLLRGVCRLLPGVTAAQVVVDPITGACKGYGYIQFRTTHARDSDLGGPVWKLRDQGWTCVALTPCQPGLSGAAGAGRGDQGFGHDQGYDQGGRRQLGFGASERQREYEHRELEKLTEQRQDQGQGQGQGQMGWEEAELDKVHLGELPLELLAAACAWCTRQLSRPDLPAGVQPPARAGPGAQWERASRGVLGRGALGRAASPDAGLGARRPRVVGHAPASGGPGAASWGTAGLDEHGEQVLALLGRLLDSNVDAAIDCSPEQASAISQAIAALNGASTRDTLRERSSSVPRTTTPSHASLEAAALMDSLLGLATAPHSAPHLTPHVLGEACAWCTRQAEAQPPAHVNMSWAIVSSEHWWWKERQGGGRGAGMLRRLVDVLQPEVAAQCSPKQACMVLSAFNVTDVALPLPLMRILLARSHGQPADGDLLRAARAHDPSSPSLPIALKILEASLQLSGASSGGGWSGAGGEQEASARTAARAEAVAMTVQALAAEGRTVLEALLGSRIAERCLHEHLPCMDTRTFMLLLWSLASRRIIPTQDFASSIVETLYTRLPSMPRASLLSCVSVLVMWSRLVVPLDLMQAILQRALQVVDGIGRRSVRAVGVSSSSSGGAGDSSSSGSADASSNGNGIVDASSSSSGSDRGAGEEGLSGAPGMGAGARAGTGAGVGPAATSLVNDTRGQGAAEGAPSLAAGAALPGVLRARAAAGGAPEGVAAGVVSLALAAATSSRALPNLYRHLLARMVRQAPFLDTANISAALWTLARMQHRTILGRAIRHRFPSRTPHSWPLRLAPATGPRQANGAGAAAGAGRPPTGARGGLWGSLTAARRLVLARGRRGLRISPYRGQPREMQTCPEWQAAAHAVLARSCEVCGEHWDPRDLVFALTSLSRLCTAAWAKDLQHLFRSGKRMPPTVATLLRRTYAPNGLHAPKRAPVGDGSDGNDAALRWANGRGQAAPARDSGASGQGPKGASWGRGGMPPGQASAGQAQQAFPAWPQADSGGRRGRPPKAAWRRGFLRLLVRAPSGHEVRVAAARVRPAPQRVALDPALRQVVTHALEYLLPAALANLPSYDAHEATMLIRCIPILHAGLQPVPQKRHMRAPAHLKPALQQLLGGLLHHSLDPQHPPQRGGPAPPAPSPCWTPPPLHLPPPTSPVSTSLPSPDPSRSTSEEVTVWPLSVLLGGAQGVAALDVVPPPQWVLAFKWQVEALCRTLRRTQDRSAAAGRQPDLPEDRADAQRAAGGVNGEQGWGDDWEAEMSMLGEGSGAWVPSLWLDGELVPHHGESRGGTMGGSDSGSYGSGSSSGGSGSTGSGGGSGSSGNDVTPGAVRGGGQEVAATAAPEVARPRSFADLPELVRPRPHLLLAARQAALNQPSVMGLGDGSAVRGGALDAPAMDAGSSSSFRPAGGRGGGGGGGGGGLAGAGSAASSGSGSSRAIGAGIGGPSGISGGGAGGRGGASGRAAAQSAGAVGERHKLPAAAAAALLHCGQGRLSELAMVALLQAVYEDPLGASAMEPRLVMQLVTVVSRQRDVLEPHRALWEPLLVDLVRARLHHFGDVYFPNILTLMSKDLRCSLGTERAVRRDILPSCRYAVQRCKALWQLNCILEFLTTYPLLVGGAKIGSLWRETYYAKVAELVPRTRHQHEVERLRRAAQVLGL